MRKSHPSGLLQVCDDIIWLKPNVTVLDHSTATYGKCVSLPDSNGWAHMTLNAKYLYTNTGGSAQTHLGLFQMCDAIAMAQA